LVINKIINKNSLTLTKNEENALWTFFSDNFKTKLTLKEFCKTNEIDEAFFVKYLTTNYLWMKFINTNIVSNVKIDESYVNQFIEFNTKDKSISYNLSEIMISYTNDEEYDRAIEVLSDLHNTIKTNAKNFEKYARKYSQSSTKDVGGLLGTFSNKDLSKDIIDKIKNINVGDISDIVCIKKDFNSGNCFIFKVNKVMNMANVSEDEKQKIKMYIKNKKIEERIKSLIEKTKNESLIKILD
jgi:hypothetical protein